MEKENSLEEKGRPKEVNAEFEFSLAKSILQWLVSEKVLTPLERNAVTKSLGKHYGIEEKSEG